MQTQKNCPAPYSKYSELTNLQINKLWCEAQQTPPLCCHLAKGQKTAISLHSQSLGGSTGLPEDHNEIK